MSRKAFLLCLSFYLVFGWVVSVSQKITSNALAENDPKKPDKKGSVNKKHTKPNSKSAVKQKPKATAAKNTKTAAKNLTKQTKKVGKGPKKSVKNGNTKKQFKVSKKPAKT